ncbi:DHH family phosphoesterase [Candidatus Parcubacteria bacterium]|nr:DHH family phosphoesterase [Candidatus Parcubacteria bacterium]
MQEINKDIAGQILAEIKLAKKILMHCHPSPDGDSLGSTLAMSHVLKAMGKEPTVIKGDSDLPKYLSKLPGYDTIVLKNIFEIDLKDFDLFLVLDTGSPDRVSKIQPLTLPLPIKTILIDHHISNQGFGDISLILSDYSSTCEILYDLLEMWQIDLSPQAAVCLFVGIYTDTGGFRYRTSKTSPPAETIGKAAKLAHIAPNYIDILHSMENSNTKGRLIAQGLLLHSIETHFNDSVAFVSVSKAELDAHKITLDDISGLDVANQLKSVIGWNMGISFIEKEPNYIGISFRSRDPERYDVAKVASFVKGGGHKAAAGARILGTLQEAKDQVLKAIAETYPDLKPGL